MSQHRSPSSWTKIATVAARDVVVAHPSLSVETLEDIMVERDISAAPVVDDDGAMIGVVTAADIVRDLHLRASTGEREWGISRADRIDAEEGFHEKAPPRVVGDVMRAAPFELAETASIADAAALMAAHGLHHVPLVSDKGRVVGFVTSLDLMRWIGDEERSRDASGRDHDEVTPLPALDDAEKFATLGALAGGVAHEINNALTYVRLSLGRLLTLEKSRRPQTHLQQHRVEMLEDVREGFQQVERIARELRGFACIDDSDAITAVDVHDVLDRAVRVIHHDVRHRARLVCDYGDVPLAIASSSVLRHVFLHVLINAAQAIPEGDAEANEVRVTTRATSSDRLIVSVHDTGTGIRAEHLPHLFDPFFTTKTQGKGLGLGLSTARDRVRSIGGEVTIESREGSGTTVRIELRASNEKPKRARATVSRDAPANARVGRILVIDDDHGVAAAVALTLAPHDVVVAPSGRAGLTILQADDRFDVVLCDLMMPEVTGMDLYDAVRALDPPLAERFVFMTGGAFTDRARRFLAEAPCPCIEKPFDPAALHEMLRSVMNRRGAN